LEVVDAVSLASSADDAEQPQNDDDEQNRAHDPESEHADSSSM
jgi:hypothetical protein